MTLDDVWHELERGRVYEATLTAQGEHVEGLQDGENIYIDPRLAVLDTLIHELIHRMRRRWSEGRVRKETAKLLFTMSDTDKARWYRKYQQTKRKSRPVRIDD